MFEYIQTLPRKGTRDIEEDLTHLCEREGVRTIISIPFTGLAYIVEDIAGKIFLNENEISQETRIILRVLEVCGESHQTIFDLMDRFNSTNNVQKKMEYAVQHQIELGKVAEKLEKILGKLPQKFLEAKQVRLA